MVIDAFRDVQAARADSDGRQNERPKLRANKVVTGRARGPRLAYHPKGRRKPTRDPEPRRGQGRDFFARFSSSVLRRNTRRRPDVPRAQTALSFETMERLFRGDRQRFILDSGGGSFPYLPLEPRFDGAARRHPPADGRQPMRLSILFGGLSSPPLVVVARISSPTATLFPVYPDPPGGWSSSWGANPVPRHHRPRLT